MQRHEPQQAQGVALPQALALAEELELPVEAGIALRVMGQAQAALGKDGAAVADESFERSLARLAGHEPYEVPRTQAQWGQVLIGGRDTGPGRRPVAQGTSSL